MRLLKSLTGVDDSMITLSFDPPAETAADVFGGLRLRSSIDAAASGFHHLPVPSVTHLSRRVAIADCQFGLRLPAGSAAFLRSQIAVQHVR